MLRFALIALTSLLTACQTFDTALQPPRSDEPVPSLSEGLTHLYFSGWDGPTISLWVYVPRDIDPKSAPIMVMMHGAKRGAARYLSEWDSVADEEGFIVLAPEFSKNDFPESQQYTRGNVYPPDSLVRNPETTWTFSAIVPSFEHVRDLLGGTQTQFTLYGHSAGSQFAHRFLFFKPDAPVSRFLLANAGWYTFADLDIGFPYGLKGTGLTEADLRIALEKDVVVLLGNADNDPNHESLRRSEGAMTQGDHRFARGQAYYRAAEATAARIGADFGWQVRVVDGVAHSNGGIAAASGDLVD